MLCFYYYEICDTNLIDPIPACAGMTRIIVEGILNSRLIHPTNTFVFAGTPGAGMTGESGCDQHHTRMPTAPIGPRANIVCVGGSGGAGGVVQSTTGGGVQ